MMMGKSMLILFVTLGIGYAFCVTAKKQEGLLKTVGYTLGISILVLSLLQALVSSYCTGPYKHGMMKKPWQCPMMMKLSGCRVQK